MAKAKRPAGKKRVIKKHRVVNPITHVKKVVLRTKKGKSKVLYSMMMVCPPQYCPKCKRGPVGANAYGSYHCPHIECGYIWQCSTCNPSDN